MYNNSFCLFAFYFFKFNLNWFGDALQNVQFTLYCQKESSKTPCLNPQWGVWSEISHGR